MFCDSRCIPFQSGSGDIPGAHRIPGILLFVLLLFVLLLFVLPLFVLPLFVLPLPYPPLNHSFLILRPISFQYTIIPIPVNTYFSVFISVFTFTSCPPLFPHPHPRPDGSYRKSKKSANRTEPLPELVYTLFLYSLLRVAPDLAVFTRRAYRPRRPFSLGRVTAFHSLRLASSSSSLTSRWR